MRWKFLRRRLSISAPRMIVRSHLPWPLRWAAVALALGFSAALALWAFEFGKEIAGLDRNAKQELAQLRVEVAELRSEREKAISIANTAESLLKTERVAQERLAQQIRQVEADNLALKNDLGFFERLFPASPNEGLAIRGLQAEVVAEGKLRYQLLLMQSGKNMPAFQGRYEISLGGLFDGRPWQHAPQSQNVTLRQRLRLEGEVVHAPQAVVKEVTVKVTDIHGAVKGTLTVKL
jgi:hypothetical protein